jgi:hypothetical protein
MRGNGWCSREFGVRILVSTKRYCPLNVRSIQAPVKRYPYVEPTGNIPCHPRNSFSFFLLGLWTTEGAWSEDGGRLETGGAAMIPCFRLASGAYKKITHAIRNELNEGRIICLREHFFTTKLGWRHFFTTKLERWH